MFICRKDFLKTRNKCKQPQIRQSNASDLGAAQASRANHPAFLVPPRKAILPPISKRFSQNQNQNLLKTGKSIATLLVTYAPAPPGASPVPPGKASLPPQASTADISNRCTCPVALQRPTAPLTQPIATQPEILWQSILLERPNPKIPQTRHQRGD